MMELQKIPSAEYIPIPAPLLNSKGLFNHSSRSTAQFGREETFHLDEVLRSTIGPARRATLSHPTRAPRRLSIAIDSEGIVKATQSWQQNTLGQLPQEPASSTPCNIPNSDPSKDNDIAETLQAVTTAISRRNHRIDDRQRSLDTRSTIRTGGLVTGSHSRRQSEKRRLLQGLLPLVTEFSSSELDGPPSTEHEHKPPTTPKSVHCGPLSRRQSHIASPGDKSSLTRKSPASHAHFRWHNVTWGETKEHNQSRTSSIHPARPLRAGLAARSASHAFVQDRKSSIEMLYEKAKIRKLQLQRSKRFQLIFEYSVYLLLLALIYFVCIGRPLWGGLVWYTYVLFAHYLTVAVGLVFFATVSGLYAFAPLLVTFEPEPAATAQVVDDETVSGANETALIIPCYRSEKLIAATIEAAMIASFPASSIFIIANGNSFTPLDNTEDICKKYSVNHFWCPVGSKIVAQYAGCYVARDFPLCPYGGRRLHLATQFSDQVQSDAREPPNRLCRVYHQIGRAKQEPWYTMSASPRSRIQAQWPATCICGQDG